MNVLKLAWSEFLSDLIEFLLKRYIKKNKIKAAPKSIKISRLNELKINSFSKSISEIFLNILLITISVIISNCFDMYVEIERGR